MNKLNNYALIIGSLVWGALVTYILFKSLILRY